MGIRELYEKKEYALILDAYLENTLNTSFNKTSRKFTEHFDKLIYTLYSAYLMGYYVDCLKLYRKVTQIFPLKDSNWTPKARTHLAEIEFISLCYIVFNSNDGFGDHDETTVQSVEKLVKHIPKLFTAANIPISEFVTEHISLFEEYKKGSYPYYTVKFLYPYEPPFDNYSFDLQSCTPYISLGVNRVPRENDCFTSFEFKISGYTKADTFWQGDSWKSRERFPEVKKTLPLLTLMLLLAAKATPGRFISPICIEQVSSVELSQYSGNHKQIKSCLGTDFTGQILGNNVPKHVFSDEELKYLNELMVSNYGSKHFVTQFYQAQNNISAGLYIESFLLFCSCLESMVYYWCGSIAELCKIQDDYFTFSNTKKSKCDTCDLFIANYAEQKPHAGIEPGLYDHVDFLREKCNVSSPICKELKKLIGKARHGNLRNDIVHGRVNNVSLNVLKQTEKTFMDIQELFVNMQQSMQKG